jgi:hypothetical protein
MMVMLLLVLLALPGAAQFRSVKVWFSGVGCASCIESMPERMRRLRGVEEAKVNAQEGTLEIQLAQQNRVRFEQIRDLIEQDGTKVTRAEVRVSGDVSNAEDRWMLKPAGSSLVYELTGKKVKFSTGQRTVAGDIPEPHPRSGPVQIEVDSCEDCQ